MVWGLDADKTIDYNKITTFYYNVILKLAGNQLTIFRRSFQ